MYFLAPFLELRKSKKRGLGVFSKIALKANTLVEISPVIELNSKDTEYIHQSKLHDYYFTWGEDQESSAIGLGYISLYNHAQKANCFHSCDFEANTISIYTKTEIEADAELFINYNMDEEKELWFDVL
ncbi:MAG: SET domain-containing protein-lysine N-methyltransferase [Bacteroidetes bacterium]|nr:SET domain-containing protein-lysine N-methyltransferase [Bacteroidota bacterium]